MKKFIIIMIVCIMTTSSVIAAGWPHKCWGPTFSYYYLKDYKDIRAYYTGCPCRDYDTLVASDYFKACTLTLNLKMPDGVTSAGGVVGYEKGVTITNGTHYSLTEGYTTRTGYGYTDSVQLKQTALPGASYSSAGYQLNNMGTFTLSAELKDTYPGNTATDSKSFYVGPYPTLSCKVNLKDDNTKDSHKDSIEITDIKLISTYRPQQLRFELYKGDTYTGKYFETSPMNDPTMVNSWGFRSKFNDINFTSTGMNLKPGEEINLSVRVIDGRGTGAANTTNPFSPKYAKYSSTPVF